MSHEFSLTAVSSIAEIDAQAWDRLVLADARADTPPAAPPGNPFLLHGFLAALEASGSATARTGWTARHLALRGSGGELVGAMPCYLKRHSQGEYVFDYGWADAFERAGGRYYPKLQVSVPFTPVTGPRLLAEAGPDRVTRQRHLLDGLKQLTEQSGASSAHLTFLAADERQLCEQAGFLLRTDQQFHWHNQGYRDFADYLAAMSSRKRKNIRKERDIALTQNGIEVDRLNGRDLTEAVWDRFFAFYMDTGSRKWGHPYLTRDFYSRIGQSMANRTLLVMARRKGKYIAGAINFLGDDAVFGRHWGCIEQHPCLHFEVCYYQAIEFAIENGIGRVEAGAQGEHKLARGYVPALTHSAHYIVHAGLRRAIADYLVDERRHVELAAHVLGEHAPFKKRIANSE